MRVVSTQWELLGTVVTLALLIGCSDSEATVTGTVTYNGEPVKKGYATFQASDGRGKSFAAPVVDGAYTVDKAFPGTKTVVVSGVREVNFSSSSAESYKKADEARKEGKLADVAEAADYIAPDAEGNSKEVEIQPGDQTLDFSITGAPIPQ